MTKKEIIFPTLLPFQFHPVCPKCNRNIVGIKYCSTQSAWSYGNHWWNKVHRVENGKENLLVCCLFCFYEWDMDVKQC